MTLLSQLLQLACVVCFAGGTERHPCRSEMRKACSGLTGRKLGECLKDTSKQKLIRYTTATCKLFIELNDYCEKEIESGCGSKYYDTSAIDCLADWSEETPLNEQCSRVVTKTKTQRDERAARAERRRLRREDLSLLKQKERDGRSKSASDKAKDRRAKQRQKRVQKDMTNGKKGHGASSRKAAENSRRKASKRRGRDRVTRAEM
eukprot:NODE_17399_length_944_cov_6.925337.p1 GENE.NODE_17399_length_944_cov_6.925337~~NODE_17399_length_944_cov_6.925337.p1  ORF type:complete len:205 (+),score=41.74 NODE_17399_length_944_cov_6.925337:114-728(+)